MLVNSIAVKAAIKRAKAKKKQMKIPNHERRRYPRIEKIITCRVEGDGFDIVTETKNISGIGAYCAVNRYIAPMAKLKINLVLPFVTNHSLKNTDRISCQGVVVRTEPEDKKNLDKYNIAIYFNRISVVNLKKIANYINSQMAFN